METRIAFGGMETSIPLCKSLDKLKSTIVTSVVAPVARSPQGMSVRFVFAFKGTGLNADGIIHLADEDCSKDLLFGRNPTLVSSMAASSNIVFDNVFAADITTKNAKYLPVINPCCAMYIPIGFTVFSFFGKELCALFI
jgi:hypothetical protein